MLVLKVIYAVRFNELSAAVLPLWLWIGKLVRFLVANIYIQS